MVGGATATAQYRGAEPATRVRGCPEEASTSERLEAGKIWVITGCSRGLGMGWVELILFSKPMDTVVAASRSPEKSEGLRRLSDQFGRRLLIIDIDVTSQASVRAAAAAVARELPDGIDYLINNAGQAELPTTFLDTSSETYQSILTLNVLGPFMVTQAFHPLLAMRPTRKILNVTSSLGSCTGSAAGDGNPLAVWPYAGDKYLAYKSSKAALNMQTTVAANALRSQGFIVVCICPGWVETDMGKRDMWVHEGQRRTRPFLDVATSCKRQLALLERMTPADSGSFFLYDGSKKAW